MSFFGSTNKLSELVQDTINTLNKTSSLQPNTTQNALAMYISVEEAINDLTILDDSLQPQQKRQFWIQIQSQISMNPSMGYNSGMGMGMQPGMGMGMGMGMQPGMGMGMGMQPGMGMGMQQPMGMGMQPGMGMGMQQPGVFSNIFGSSQPQSQGSSMFGSSGGMFGAVLQQLQQIKTQLDSNTGMGGQENDMTDSVKVMSIQPILIQTLISLNTLAMQLFPMAHPGRQIENILQVKAACELGSGSGFGTRSAYGQQNAQYGQRFGRRPGYVPDQGYGQGVGYENEISYARQGGKRRRTRRRRQSGGGFVSASHQLQPYGGRRRKSHKKNRRSHRR
jgi:hypothetical protein